MKKPDSVQSSSKLARTSLAALEKAVEKLGGTPRTGQELMAQTVAEIADEGGHLLVQAGTGTGKSLGYLIPAMVYVVQNEQVAVVSTANLAPQRQGSRGTYRHLRALHHSGHGRGLLTPTFAGAGTCLH